MDETELQALYSQVVELSQNIPNCQRLEDADATATMVSPLCGSQISVDLKLHDGTIEAFGQKVRACTLGAAAAAIVGGKVVGRSARELKALRDTMRTMLKENGPPPDGDWQQLALLVSARDLVSRHGSIMLVFDAISEAIDEIQDPCETLDTGPSGKGIPDTIRT